MGPTPAAPYVPPEWPVWCESRPGCSQEHTISTIIAGPPIGDGDADELPAAQLPVWSERGEMELMEAAAVGALLEALSQAQCPGQRALTA